MEGMNIILGTMQFGERVFGKEVKEMIETFSAYGYSDIDTAYVYNDGESERLIGETLESTCLQLSIATKVNPRVTGKLDKTAVLSQFDESLRRMRLDGVNTLYLHFPDPNTPVEDALEACAYLHSLGKFKELGLSNFPAWLVAEVYHICKSHGWVLPTIYEGLYNPLSRHAERELDLALDYYNIKFIAYNPLAGGLLTDKYVDRTLKEGRFINRPNYQKRYWHESYFKAIERIWDVCSLHSISIAEASYRWLAYHSMLKVARGDGIIIGASNKDQLIQNLNAVTKGKLPNEVVGTINDAWEVSKTDAPEYFTFYKSNFSTQK